MASRLAFLAFSNISLSSFAFRCFSSINRCGQIISTKDHSLIIRKSYLFLLLLFLQFQQFHLLPQYEQLLVLLFRVYVDLEDVFRVLLLLFRLLRALLLGLRLGLGPLPGSVSASRFPRMGMGPPAGPIS